MESLPSNTVQCVDMSSKAVQSDFANPSSVDWASQYSSIITFSKVDTKACNLDIEDTVGGVKKSDDDATKASPKRMMDRIRQVCTAAIH